MSFVNVQDFLGYLEEVKLKKPSNSVPRNLPEGLGVEFFDAVKVVTKPWGFEWWLAHDPSLPYAFKMTYMHAGKKMSLQYHRQKTEHIIIFAGQINLHYQDPSTHQILCSSLSEGCVIKVLPPTIHRIEAVTDVFLVEVSTNHLDDIVRVGDDYEGPDGRIESEHQ